jgi:hypothetical protein
VKRGGKQIRRSLRTKDREVVERRLDEFNKKSGIPVDVPEKRRLTAGEIVEVYLRQHSAAMKSASSGSKCFAFRSFAPSRS